MATLTESALDSARRLAATDGRQPLRARICNVLDEDALWAMAEAVPEVPRVRGGRPRAYPVWVFLAFDALIHEFGSAVEVAREIADPDIWQMFEEAAKSRYPQDPAMWPGPSAPKRYHYQYAKRSVLIEPGTLDDMGDSLRREAAQLALEMGLCDPNGGGSWTHPDLKRTLYGDGTVVTPRYKSRPGTTTTDRRTGEIKTSRVDPDAEDFVTGGGQQVHGLNFVFLFARGPQKNERVILDARPAPKAGGEARHALDAFHQVAPLLPGAQVALYDGAMRGVHLRELYGMGLLPIANMGKAPGGVPKEAHLGTVTGRLPSGAKVNLDVHLRNGSPCLKTLKVDGAPMLTRLERKRMIRRPDVAGYRFYQDYKVPSHVPALGGAEFPLRLNESPSDTAIKLNREEYLRAIPPEDDDFPRLYGRRNDAESGNRTLDDSMWRGRSHSVGRAGTHLNMMTFALFKNAQARGLFVRSSDPPGAASTEVAA